jgi:hypothetical protein
MRHLYGVALAVLLAAALFFGAAWGYMMVTRGVDASISANGGELPAYGAGMPAGGGSLFQNGHVVVGGAAMLAVGLAAGLLLVIPWVSPLAAGLPGLVLVAWTALYVADVQEAVRLIPLKSRDFGTGFETLLFYGLLGMAGLVMIVPLFIPSRWRRPSRLPGYAAVGASTLVQPAAVFPGTAVFPGMGAGFTLPSGGYSNVLPDEDQTRTQQSPVTPPDGSPAL